MDKKKAKRKLRDKTLTVLRSDLADLRTDLTDLIRDFVSLTDRRFAVLENKVGAVQISIEKAKSELQQQIEGLGMRIDDLSSNRAKYSDMDILQNIRRRLENVARKNK